MYFDNITYHGAKKFFLSFFFNHNMPLYDGICLVKDIY